MFPDSIFTNIRIVEYLNNYNDLSSELGGDYFYPGEAGSLHFNAGYSTAGNAASIACARTAPQ